MTIRIEDLDKTDFSDIVSGEHLAPVKPGDILLHDFMKTYSLSANALAKALHVPANRITAIINGTRSITADTAMRLARYYGTDEQFWLNLQMAYDLETARLQQAERIKREVTPRAA